MINIMLCVVQNNAALFCVNFELLEPIIHRVLLFFRCYSIMSVC